MNKFISSIGLVCLLLGVANAQIISKDGVAKDTVTGLEWQDNDNVDRMDLKNAITYCQNLEIGSFTDWRLANINELLTLIDSTKDNTTHIVEGFRFSSPKPYWSTTSFNAPISNEYFVLSPSYGTAYNESISEKENIRCVRGTEIGIKRLTELSNTGQLKIESNDITQILNQKEIQVKKATFVHELVSTSIVSKNGIATDSVTKLMWQDKKDSSKKLKTLKEALLYCENLSLGGYSDWRTPNIYELATLLDNGGGKPYCVNGFENRYDAYTSLWSSSLNLQENGKVFFIHVGDGYLSGGRNFDSVAEVRCVRGIEIIFFDLKNLKEKNQIKISDGNFEEIPHTTNSLTLNQQDREKIQLTQAKNNDQLSWEEAVKIHSVRGFQSYIKEFPNGQYLASAQTAMEIVDPSIKIMREKDQNTYNNVASQNTIAAYKAYLKEFPNGQYASSARSNIQYLEEENRFRALLQSKSPQTMYIEAGKQERNGNTSKANKLYEAIIDRFPNSDFAVKASDKLTGAIRTERAESNRRSQSRQECENNKNACLAGCGTYISGADSHNSAVWSCNDKCKQISCY